MFYYEFEFIHPFADGNGRAGRFWQSLILQKWKPLFAWLPMEALIQERQDAYYEALNTAGSQGEPTAFVFFMLSTLRDALAEIRETQNVGRNGGINVGRNRHEAAVLTVLRRQPHATAKAIAEVSGLSSRQVERILAALKKEGAILRLGPNKGGRWEVKE